MKTKKYLVWVLFVSVFLSGCISNPINARTGANYYEWGMGAERRGDLNLARQNFSRAYANAQMGNLGPVAEAYSLYEWSRVTGYLGMYADSEKGFNDVLSLIEKAEGKADDLKPPTLAELSRLLHDTNQHDKAIEIYEKAIIELDKRDIIQTDPIGYANFLDDYSVSLRATGNVSRADDMTSRANKIKEDNRDRDLKFSGRRYKNP